MTLPPNLLYLTIYNPTLRPSVPVDPDDEDAEEQAHILFYTSRDRAASRDRTLRQVGLAKALVNFSALVLYCIPVSPARFILYVGSSTQSSLATMFIRKREGWAWSPPNRISGYMQ